MFNESLTGSRTHLGKGVVPLRSLLPVATRMETTDIKILLTNNKSNQQKGFVLLKGHLSVPKVEEKKPPTLFKPYEGRSQTLTLIVDQMEAKELVDTGGMLDKQDPALQIKIGKQVYSTQR